MKVRISTKNNVESILPALIVSIKTDMGAAYEEQFAAVKKLRAAEGMNSSDAIEIAIDDLKALDHATRLISDALDKAFKPKRAIIANKMALCPHCNHRIPHLNHSYCHRCGQKLQTSEGSGNE